jgi:hypothetical protein
MDGKFTDSTGFKKQHSFSKLEASYFDAQKINLDFEGEVISYHGTW